MDYAKNFNQSSLMAYAKTPADGLTQAFAGLVLSIARAGAALPALPMGVSRERFGRLLEGYFPGALEALFEDFDLSADESGCPGLRSDEMDDLLALLLEHRSSDAEHTTWLAYAIAAGCMGDGHLYHDMGLPDRQALSNLLMQNFTALFEKNSGNMKWKKFFYKQLCERAEVNMCQAPSCQVCHDYLKCFGPEDDTGLAALSIISNRGPRQA